MFGKKKEQASKTAGKRASARKRSNRMESGSEVSLGKACSSKAKASSSK